MKNIIVLIFVIVLTACAPTPQDVADAEQTRILAIQQAAKQVQEMNQQQAEWERTQAVWKRITEQVSTAASVFVWVGLVSLSAAALGAGAGTGIAAVQTGRAWGRRAMMLANLFPVDPRTGQLPVYLHKENGAHTLANPNDGEVLDLTKERAADRDKVANSGRTQRDGVISRNLAEKKFMPYLGIGLGIPKKRDPVSVISYEEVNDDG